MSCVKIREKNTQGAGNEVSPNTALNIVTRLLFDVHVSPVGKGPFRSFAFFSLFCFLEYLEFLYNLDTGLYQIRDLKTFLSVSGLYFHFLNSII